MEKLTSRFLRNVGGMVRTIHSISDIKYRELNLQKGQFIFLTRICENPGINLAELSLILKVDKGTTTKAIQKLIEAEYIDKIPDSEDRRGFKLYPKEKALETYDFVIEEENRSISVCFEGFSEEEKNCAEKLLEKMSKNVEHDWNNRIEK